MRPTLAFSFLLGALALCGAGDFQSQKAQQEHQCEMIEEGHWPASVNQSCTASK